MSIKTRSFAAAALTAAGLLIFPSAAFATDLEPGVTTQEAIIQATGKSAQPIEGTVTVSSDTKVTQATTPSGDTLETLVQDHGQDGYAVIAVLESGSQAQFDLDLPEGARLAPGTNGELIAYSENDTGGIRATFGVIEQPWAVDATGKELPTHYRVVSDTTIEQVVDTRGAEYPVVADPKFRAGFHLGPVAYVDHNKAETRNAASSAGSGGVWVTASCALLPGRTAQVLCLGIIGTETAHFNSVAKDAAAKERCLTMRIPILPSAFNAAQLDAWHTPC